MSFEQAFIDACDEVGCEHDNEALLIAIKKLKDAAHPQPAPEGLREALEPFARYFRLNDCEGRKDDEAIEVPIGDLRRAADALSPTKAGAES